jgi:hypothetical protein
VSALVPYNCEQTRQRLWLHLYSELAIEEDEAVEMHLSGCTACVEELERLEAAFAAIDRAQEDPPPSLLALSRRGLFDQLEKERQPRPFAWLTGWWRLAGALAALVLTFFAGHYGDRVLADESNAGNTVASRVRGVERGANGDIHLLVEEIREVSVSGRPSDEKIRRLLLSAAQDPTDAGLRVASVDLLRRESAEMDVRRALMAALETDPNPGVRLKALEGLRPFGGDPEVRRSLGQVLLRDENTGLRAQAVDLLVEHQQRDLVGLLQSLMEGERNDYIRLRSQRALREMKASVTTF